jgi:hypothetical protein
MGWWFGRKSAPADARPFVPAWLKSADEEVGFARSVEGMSVYVRTSGTWALYRSGSWEIGTVRGSTLVLNGNQVVGGRASAIGAPAGGSTIDAGARSAIGQILAALRQHGLIET